MSKQPNVLFIISDDHRYDAICAFGNEEVKTPILDQLAEDGVSFTHTHIMGGFSGAVCMPSRASVHSGANVFVSGGDFEINPELSLMPETIKLNGYKTYAIGKWHNDLNSFQRSFQDGAKLFFRGMSEHYEVPYHEFNESGNYSKEDLKVSHQHSSELFTGAAIDFLENNDQKDPFFLYVAYTAPHDPRTAPEEYHDLYDPDQISVPPNFMPEHPFDNGELDVRDEHLASFPRGKREVQEHIADYYAMITHMDAQIGRLIETLENTGQKENTIIVYTADHGLSVGQHGLMGKQNMYDHSIRIPFIMKGPGLPKGETVESLTCQIDIYPTLCSVLGVEVPETVEGKSLLPLIAEEKQSVRNYIFSVYCDLQRMVKNDRFKLIRYYRDDEKNIGTNYVQLFDLKSDPWEMTNLAKDPKYMKELQQLATKLADWQQKVNDPLKDIPVLPKST